MKTIKLLIRPGILLILLVCNVNGITGQNETRYVDYVDTIIDSIPHQSVGGVAVDAFGYVYAADFEDNIWKINPKTKKASLFVKGLYTSSGNTFDSRGNLYQSSLSGNYISKIDREGNKEIFADSLIIAPVGITTNSKGEFFVCNCYDYSISKISPQGETSIFTRSHYFHCANGIAADSNDNLYVVTFNSNDVLKVSPEGEVTHFAKTPDKMGNGHLTIVNNIMYITGFHGHRIYRLPLEGGEVEVLTGTGERSSLDGPGHEATFSYPNGIAASPDGKTLYVNDMHGELANHSLQPGKSMIRAIKLFNVSDLMKQKIKENGITGIRDYYLKLKSQPRFKNVNTSAEMNTLGNNLMMKRRYDEAEAVLQLNLETYPENILSHVFLARTMYLSDRIEKAKQYYQKAIELNPKSELLKHRLKLLENEQ